VASAHPFSSALHLCRAGFRRVAGPSQRHSRITALGQYCGRAIVRFGVQPALADAVQANEPSPRRRHASPTNLLGPLDRVLVSGGDFRLTLDPATGVNKYGCKPGYAPETLSFSSSTATSISERAYDRANLARDHLLRSALKVGFDRAFDDRLEAMREELKSCLALSGTGTEVVLSPSGTDSQLHALFVTRALLGPNLTTIIVAADQTGSGTVHTALGRHFSDQTAGGGTVRCATPVDGLGETIVTVALPTMGAMTGPQQQSMHDEQVLTAVARAIADGSKVLLQIMESSKLGWRLPSDSCADEIAGRWPGQVQIVVDACQMRIGRPRLRAHLARGHMVLITGSKYFAGPAFSGALLIPALLSGAVGAIDDIPPGLFAYAGSGDWPQIWKALRSRFPVRHNFGQWLRWEAALEEIRAYYEVPIAFRRQALAAFADSARQIFAASPSLRPLPPPVRANQYPAIDEEMTETTIFPFTLRRDGHDLDIAPSIYRALQSDCGGRVAPDAAAAAHQIAARCCLIGQPVTIAGGGEAPIAALRICADARLVTASWSPDPELARLNLAKAFAGISTIAAKIELLLDSAAAK
jgi:hypothetical protein